MKNKVIQWLKRGCPFKEGMALLPDLRIFANLRRIFSIQGNTPKNAAILEYQLCRHCGISEKEAAVIKKSAAKPIKPKVIIPVVPTPPVDNFTEHPQPTILSPETLMSYPVEAHRSKLREDFPFLGHADCPDELKILVSDKLTAYHNYIKAHERLFVSQSDSDIHSASRDTVEYYLDNRAILQELEHYKKTGKLLKRHPFFKRQKREAEISRLSASALVKLKNQLEMNIWRNKSLLEKEPGHRLTGDRLSRIDDYQHELTFVNGLLENR